MMRFVNRVSERERLTRVLSREESVFVVVYGRRRCGKSRLIREIVREGDLYFMADQSEARQQRALLARVVETIIPGFGKVVYPDWETLFEALNSRIVAKTTVFLDEFPYMVRSSPELPSVLQKLIDNKAELRFNLLICGSSQQLMSGLVFDSAAPLFGRGDEVVRIKPMQPAYLQEVFQCAAAEAVEEFSVWGGIPRYWELRLTEASLFDALKYHLLTSQGMLYDEPLRLFLDDMRDTVHSFTILSLIADGCNRLSEIASRLGKPSTHLAGPLEKLLTLGYIEREIPFGENIRNSKKSLYKVADPFLHFYFRFVVPNRSFIETELSDILAEKIKLHFNTYVASHWEKICRDVVPGLSFGGISFLPASRWWGTPSKGVELEVDLVAESPDGKYLLVGECKWNEKALDQRRLLNDLGKKAALLPFSRGKTIVTALFLKTGNRQEGEWVYFPEDVLVL